LCTKYWYFFIFYGPLTFLLYLQLRFAGFVPVRRH